MSQTPPFDPYRPPTSADYGPPAPAADREVSEAIMELMRQTKPWVTFLAILGFLGAGFMVLLGLFAMGAGALGGSGPKLPAALGLVYVAFAGIYIYPSLCLLRYGSSIGRLLQGGGMEGLVEALRFQKSFWRFTGITAAVLLVVYVVAIVIGVGVGVFMAASHAR